jgi:hypothetical protein
MPDNSPAAPRAGKITLFLLDPAKGSPIQTWEFDSRAVVRVGRGAENDIVIQDPQVSRVHAELQFVRDHWELINRGRNGTLVAGASVESAPIKTETSFRLGMDGPMFRFYDTHRTIDQTATLLNLDLLGPSIHIDQEKKARDVEDIVESEYFRQLRQTTKQLKSRTAATEDPTAP